MQRNDNYAEYLFVGQMSAAVAVDAAIACYFGAVQQNSRYFEHAPLELVAVDELCHWSYLDRNLVDQFVGCLSPIVHVDTAPLEQLRRRASAC